jgi:hypothetical protein
MIPDDEKPSMNDDQLKQRLLQADADFAKSTRPAIELAEIGRRIRRRRNWRIMIGGAAVVCCALVWQTMLAPDITPGEAPSSATARRGARETTVTVAHGDVQHLRIQAELFFEVAETLRRQRQLSDLRAKLVSESLQHQPELDLPTDEWMARLSLCVAKHLDKSSRQPDSARREYQRVIREFPDTVAAAEAQQWLATTSRTL